MTDEEVKSYLCTQQLTDYREDWPNGKKGCLFLVYYQSIHDACLMILDFPWRKGAKWEEYPKLLPYEKTAMEKSKRDFEITDFGAILVGVLIRENKKKHRADPWDEWWDSLWEAFIGEPDRDSDFSVANSLNEFLNFERAEDELHSIMPGGSEDDHIHAQLLIETLWRNKLSDYIDQYFKNISLKDQLFHNDITFSIPKYQSFEIPVRLYKSIDKDEYERTGHLSVDYDLYEEDFDTETWEVEETHVSSGGLNTLELCIQEDVPVSYDKYADIWQQEGDEFVAIDYSDGDFSAETELVYDEMLAKGLTALLIPYSAVEMYRDLYLFETLEKASDILSHSSIPLSSVEITATREVYDTYFEHFCQTYQNQHESDPGFICLQQKERQLVYARAALEQETDYIALSQDIYRYLTPEQGKLLHQYVEGYLTFLKGRIEEIEPAPTLPAVAAATPKNVLPPKGDYKAVMQWLNEQKEMGNYWFKEADYNYEELCRRLSEIFGWVVIANSLIKRIKRDQQ